jgi:predicted 2-oxoglutarate/Fe(II)-dependent dioxygenase YbiX
VLCFFGSAASMPWARRLLEDVERARTRFDGTDTFFCGVSVDPADEQDGAVFKRLPGIEFLWDTDRSVSRAFGAAPPQGTTYWPHTLILGRDMRVLAVLPFTNDAQGEHFAAVLRVLDQLPPLAAMPGLAPVLQVPHVFEPDFCRTLIQTFESHGGRDIGILREVDGRAVRVIDNDYKRRTDHEISDPQMVAAVHARLSRRLVPEIKKAFQFSVTRIERNTIGCYDSANGGHFHPHRDDSNIGAAHRRFAVTINLNAEEYAGGDLRFREFGLQTYRAPTGGAIVFSCGLLHEVLPVERGKRYAFLPFLFDEEAERVRLRNWQMISAPAAGAAAPAPAPAPLPA